jgi:cyanate permease
MNTPDQRTRLSRLRPAIYRALAVVLVFLAATFALRLHREHAFYVRVGDLAVAAVIAVVAVLPSLLRHRARNNS